MNKKITLLLVIVGALACIGILAPKSKVPTQPDAGTLSTQHDDNNDSRDPSQEQHTPATQASAQQAEENVSTSTPRQIDSKLPSVVAKHADNTFTASNGKRYPIRTYKTSALPNDPGGNQWWVGNTGLPSAWDYGSGSYQTTIAVIDTGFALDHEELAGRWHINSGEQGVTTVESPSVLNCTDRGMALNMSCNNIDDDGNGVVDDETGIAYRENPSRLNCTDQGKPLDKSCNNIDDDGNGLADDLRGWDFASFDNSVQAGETNPSGPGTEHGTMVSGVLGATGNNGKGIAGVNWSTKILPLQALDDDDYGNTLTVANAVIYAADQGVDIISISLGASDTDPWLREAIGYAIDSGALVVAASGNDGCDCVSYPANFPEVLAVGSHDDTTQPSWFSNYGTNLDLLAPGEAITTSTWGPSNGTSLYQSGVAGTSFSTPYVAGLLGLAKSHQPNATWGELVGMLTEETNHAALTQGSPRSNMIGFGYVRADNLLRRTTTPVDSLQRYQFSPITSNDTLGSQRAYQCENGNLPTTMIYELTRNGELRLTNSTLTRKRAIEEGWSTKPLFYSCVGQIHDNVTTLRNINLPREIYNRDGKGL